jgi:acylaminoacyl-peptidase
LMPAKRTDNKLPGCVVFPHGGPHSVYSTSWYATSVYFALAGLAVLHINYRGSTGFGEKFVECLPSRIAALDVIDCIDATHDIINQSLVDKDNLTVFGGSHGGFLGLHLIGQYADMFKACVVRNPVCNVAAMVGLSDIPDWCMYEAGFSYDARTPPTIQQQQQMLAASPIAHVNKVKTPTYLMLGTADRRVPPAQALDYGRYLKTNNIVHRIAVYPDCQHSLDDKVDITFNMAPDCLLWLLQRFYTTDDIDSNKTMDLSIPKQ